MSNSEDKYEVVFKNKRVKRGWDELEEKFPERMAACKDFLKKNPEDRRKAVGIL